MHGSQAGHERNILIELRSEHRRDNNRTRGHIIIGDTVRVIAVSAKPGPTSRKHVAPPWKRAHRAPSIYCTGSRRWRTQYSGEQS